MITIILTNSNIHPSIHPPTNLIIPYLPKSSQVKELFHGDVLVFGSSTCFSVNLSQFPVRPERSSKAPWWALGPRERSKMISEIRSTGCTGSSTSSGSLQVALHYASVLQGQNLDREGVQNFDQFLGNAKRAAELVAQERGG